MLLNPAELKLLLMLVYKQQKEAERDDTSEDHPASEFRGALLVKLAYMLGERYRTSLREQLAAYAHETWSGWMRYMFDFDRCSKCDDSTDVLDLPLRVPAVLVERWQRQMEISYVDFPEDQKDRTQADKILAIMETECEPTAVVELRNGEVVAPRPFKGDAETIEVIEVVIASLPKCPVCATVMGNHPSGKIYWSCPSKTCDRYGHPILVAGVCHFDLVGRRR